MGYRKMYRYSRTIVITVEVHSNAQRLGYLHRNNWKYRNNQRVLYNQMRVKKGNVMLNANNLLMAT
jgi:hypothetical protein